MFGLEPSIAAVNTLKIFKEKKIKKIVELGAGLGRDTIFFAKNSIKITALDYSPAAIKIIIAIMKYCIASGDTVSAKTEKGLLFNISAMIKFLN